MLKELRNKIYRVLRWSERYTKTDMLYLTKGGFWVSLGQVVASLSGLLLAIGFANLVPKEVYGTYKFILAATAIFLAFSLSGLGRAVMRAVARGHTNALRIGFLTYLKWSFCVTFFGFAAAAYYFFNDNSTLALSFLFAGTLAPLMASAAHYDPYLTGKKEFSTKMRYDMFRTVTPALALLGTIALTHNVVIIVGTYFISNTIAALIAYYWTLRRFELASDTAAPQESFVSYGKHLSVMNILGSVAGNLDKILMFHFLGAAQLAVYSFAIAVPQQLRAVNKMLATLAAPKFSTSTIQKLKSSFPRKASFLFVAGALFAILYIIFAPLIYQTLFPEYIDSIIYSQVFALIFLGWPIMLFYEALVAHEQTKSLYVTQTVLPITRILLLLVLLPLFGIWGAIIALLATRAIGVILYFVLFRRL